jgi:hypothetical protein
MSYEKKLGLTLMAILSIPQMCFSMTVADAMPSTRQTLLPKKEQIMQTWTPDSYGKCSSVGIKISASQIKGAQFSDETVVLAALLMNAGAIYEDELSRRNGNGAKNALKNVLQSYTQEFLNISQERFNSYFQQCANILNNAVR